MDIAPADLSQKLPALLAETRGLNVTIPHKQAVIPFLTRLEGRAALYRSVNTIAVTPEGAVGHNTDADGFLCALKAAGVPLKGRAALLGCGGVGRTFACEAALAGCSIINAVREADQEAAAALKDYVLTLAPGTDYTIVSLDMLAGQGEIDLLINATPVGMYPHADAAPVDQAAVSAVPPSLTRYTIPGVPDCWKWLRRQAQNSGRNAHAGVAGRCSAYHLVRRCFPGEGYPGVGSRHPG